jgi:glutamate N-acetyltransferase/amino-acid N-acetyltransferase
METNYFNNIKIIHEGTITDVSNFFASSCHCGLRKFREDFCVLYTPEETCCSGMFTSNKFAAAPVVVNKEQLTKTRVIKAIIISSGIANACTGLQGIENAKHTIELASRYLNLNTENILVASTGRIGKQLPMDKVERGISICSKNLSRVGGHNAARAILTIDKNSKEIAIKYVGNQNDKINIKNNEITIGGIAKGSVMIEPDMATILIFLAADVKISSALLDEALRECVDNTFNCISTDGCQSTNDMILMLANGASGIEIAERDKNFNDFKNALFFVLKALSLKVVEDAEGATKIIEINVINAHNKLEARSLGKKIANSILFKTAMFGEDLNWGRIATAIGSVEHQIDQNKVDIYLDDIQVMKNGQANDFDIEHGNRLMKNKNLKFVVDLKAGNDSAIIYTNDISYDYIKINAEYKKQK